MYNLADIKSNCIKLFLKEQRRLLKKFKTENLYFFIEEDFLSISAKCIYWQLYYEIVKTRDLYKIKDNF